MQKRTGISNEYIITRHLNGIKLVRPDQVINENARQLFSVNDVMDLPFNVFVTDTNHRSIFVNDSVLKSCHLASRSDARGRVLDKISADKLYAARIYANDIQVMANDSLQIFDEYSKLIDDHEVNAISFKMPWYDSNNRTIGVFGCATVINNDSFSDLARHLTSISEMFLKQDAPEIDYLHLKDNNNKYYTAREIDIITWTVRGKSMREIAEILGLSRRTVENYFERIKSKAGVKTKSQLIEKVLRNKHVNIIGV